MHETATGTIALPDALIGGTFYKIAYVTNDRDRAIEHFTEKLGFEEFVSFEPAFEAELSDGSKSNASLRCAFSTGRDIYVELMEPVEGAVDLWAAPLEGRSGLAFAFHHFGHVVADLAAVRDAYAQNDIQPELVSTLPVGTFGYWKPPGLGHYMEYMQYFGDGGNFLESLRTRPWSGGSHSVGGSPAPPPAPS